MATLFLGKCYLQCKFLESGFKKTTAFVMALIMCIGAVPDIKNVAAKETSLERIEVDMPDAILGGTIELRM